MKRTAFLMAILLTAAGVMGCRSQEEINEAHQQQQQKPQEIILKQEPPPQEHRVLRVTGNGRIAAAPDLATVCLAVSAEAATTEEAELEAQAVIDAVEAALFAAGVSRGDCKVRTLTLYPILDQGKNPPVTTGYSATTIMTVTVRTPEKVGTLVGSALEAGAAAVQSVEFALQDETAVYREALAAAVEDAGAKALRIAQTTQLELEGPTLVEETSVRTDLEAEKAKTEESSEGEDTAPNLEAQRLVVTAEVLVEYWLD